MPFLQKLGQTVDTLFGGDFQRASQNRERHALDVDHIKQNMDYQRQQMVRQRGIDAISRAQSLASLIPVANIVDPNDRIQANLNGPKRMDFQTSDPMRTSGTSGFMPDVTVDRPVNQARRVEIPGANGGPPTALELMTNDDLYRRDMRRGEDRIQMELGKYSAQQNLDDASRGRMLTSVHQANLATDSAAAEEKLRTQGVEPPDLIRKYFNIPDGTKVLPERLQGLVSAYATAHPKASAPHYETDDKGNTTAIVLDDQGNPIAKPVGRYGKSKSPPAGDGAVGANDPLVAAVLANPAILDNLTPTAKTRIAPALQQAGFGGFGKGMGEGAIDRLADGDAAVNSILDLTKTLEANNANVGPIVGRIMGKNPYSDMQAVRAEVDLVRQRVGKAFEGGVLRKEDELKYMKILPTMEDTPANAIAKAKLVAKTLQNDLRTYRETQKANGRRVPEGTGQRPATGTTRPPLSSFEGK